MFGIEKCVYHYTRSDTAAEYILPSMSLRMGLFEKLNDPREAKTWPFKFYARSPELRFDPEIFRAASEFVTKRSLILCCTRDDPAAKGEPLRMGFGHPRMWSQYADNHRGICLVLDQEDLNATITKVVGSECSVRLNTNETLTAQMPFLGFFLTRGSRECILRKSKRGEWGGDINSSTNGCFWVLPQ